MLTTARTSSLVPATRHAPAVEQQQVAPPTSDRPSLYCTMSKHSWSSNSLLSRSLQQPSTIQSSILLCVSKTQQKQVERGRTKRQRTREDEEESKTRRRERPIRQCTSAVGFVSRYVSSSFPSFTLHYNSLATVAVNYKFTWLCSRLARVTSLDQ
jgi:hypothetical protein